MNSHWTPADLTLSKTPLLNISNAALPSERLTANISQRSKILIDEAVRRCRGSDGGEFNKADSRFMVCLHKLPPPLSPEPSRLIHGGDLDEDKDISQHKR